MRLTHTTACVAAIGAAFTMTHAHEGDIGLLLIDGQIVTAVADDVTGGFDDIGERVFGAEMLDTGASIFGDEPGFFTTDGPTNTFGAFSAGTTIGYNTIAALRVWDGSDFDQIATPRLGQDAFGNVIETPDTDQVVAGHSFLYSGGEFDEHPDYLLLGDTAPGIYLWQIEFFANDGSGGLIDESETIFVVFNFDVDDDEHDRSIEWVVVNLVPTPGSLGVLAFGALAASRRRRPA